MGTLDEKLSRYSRLIENEDFTKTIKELDDAFGLGGSVIPVCNCPNASEYLFAREGMRTYRDKLMGLKEETEQAVEAETQGEIDE